MNVTSTMLFRTDTPANAMKPTAAEIENDQTQHGTHQQAHDGSPGETFYRLA